MALILSPLASAISGSLCGLTFRRSPASGILVYTKPAPPRRSSKLQTLFRSCFSDAVAAWTICSESDRASWQGFGGRNAMLKNHCLKNYLCKASSISRSVGTVYPHSSTNLPDPYDGWTQFSSWLGLRIWWKNFTPYHVRFFVHACFLTRKYLRSPAHGYRIDYLKTFTTGPGSSSALPILLPKRYMHIAFKIYYTKNSGACYVYSSPWIIIPNQSERA